MKCMWCNGELSRGRHFLCDECLTTKVGGSDYGTLTAIDTYYEVVPISTTNMLDSADLRRDVKERLNQR
jgi:hypothetical protein